MQTKQILPNRYGFSFSYTIKACVRYVFIKFFFFHQMIASPSKTEKCFLFYVKSSLFSRDIQIFVFFPLPLHFS